MMSVSWAAPLRLLLLLCALLPAPLQASAKTNQSNSKLPPGFSYLHDIAPTIIQDMRYATKNNFTGHVLPGYEAPECILRTKVAQGLLQVQAALEPTGYSLKVYDCYRPARAVRAFGVWANDLQNHSTKDYYPRLAKTRLYGKGYIAKRSGHSRGSAVDLTLVRLPAARQPAFDTTAQREACNAPLSIRPADNSIDMGTNFDCFDVMSHTTHQSITGEVKRNRLKLRTIMQRFGFKNYWREWWHYSYKKRTLRIYHDFPIAPRS